jgi:cysteine desulfurase
MDAENARILGLRDRLWQRLSTVAGVRLNGHPERRLPGNLNVSFAGIDGETLLNALDDVAVSSGSACTSATVEPSYVLRALGLPDDLAHASLRITLGRFTTAAEVDYAADRIVGVVEKLRARSAA